MKKILHMFSSFMLITTLFSGTTLQAGAVNPDNLASYVRKSMKLWQVPGLSMAVVQDGEVVFNQGFGLRDIQGTAEVTPETVFAIGSSTKAFTASALAMLVDQGRLSWDAPIIDYLPSFRLQDPWVSSNICLRDMLSHRTGLKGADVLWVWREGALTRDQLVRSMRYEQIAFPFRSTWHYNNLMYMTAGQVLPAVTGLGWADFIRKHIFEPLGMQASNTSVNDLSGLKNVALPHILLDGEVQRIPYRNIDMISPAGSINSNIVDMVKWLKFQLADGSWRGDDLISKQSILTMRSPQISMPIPFPVATFPGAHFLGYGLAWFLHDYHGVKVVEHGGNIDGMTAMVALVPEKKSGLVILSNMQATRLREVLMYYVLDRILDRPELDWNPHFTAIQQQSLKASEEAINQTKDHRVEGTSPRLDLGEYVGSYRSDQMGELTITLEGGRLHLTYQGKTVPLSHWHYDTFRLPQWNIEDPGIDLLNFLMGPEGTVDSLHEDSLGDFKKSN